MALWFNPNTSVSSATSTPRPASTMCHIQGEEAGILRVAEEMGLGDQYVYDLEDDHRRFDNGLTADEALDARALEEILKEIYRHIAVEEYDLFREVSQMLGMGWQVTRPDPISDRGPLGDGEDLDDALGVESLLLK